jgi:uncharacterized protein (TIGR00251 family)
MAPYLQEKEGGVCLSVKVQPRASKNAIGEALGTELKIKIAAPPVDSAANDALIRFLAAVLECARGNMQLIRGQTSRHKQIFIRDMSLAEVEEKIKAWPDS